jgi:hypothetical protein
LPCPPWIPDEATWTLAPFVIATPGAPEFVESGKKVDRSAWTSAPFDESDPATRSASVVRVVSPEIERGPRN